QTQAGQPGQHLGAGLGEAGQEAGQADRLAGGGGQVVGAQPQGGVGRAVARPAGGAAVGGPGGADGAQQGDEGGGLVTLEACRAAAGRAGGARAYVAPFLRPSRAACRALAPALRTRSRRVNSVAPRSWPSGLAASSSAICLMSVSREARRAS